MGSLARRTINEALCAAVVLRTQLSAQEPLEVEVLLLFNGWRNKGTER